MRTQLSMPFSRASICFQAALRAQIVSHGVAGLIEPGMGPILFALAKKGGHTLSALALAAGVPRSTMTGLAARMVSRRLIELRKNHEDGRERLVFLDTAGRQVLPKLRKIERALDQIFRSALPEGEADRFGKQLTAVAARLAMTESADEP